jgi:hypothetical protein
MTDAQLATRHSPATVAAVLEQFNEGRSLEEIAALPGMPSTATLWRMVEEDEGLRAARARARAREAAGCVSRAEAELAAVTPDALAEFGKGASALVQLAKTKSDLQLWKAARLDRSTWGESLNLDAKVQVAALVAFVDSTARVVEADAVVSDASVKPPEQPSAYQADKGKPNG